MNSVTSEESVRRCGRTKNDSVSMGLTLSRVPLRGLILLFFVLFALSSCGIYSFTGTTLSPDIKSVTVKQLCAGYGGRTRQPAINVQ